MPIRIVGAPRTSFIKPQIVGPGRVRKIGILGTAATSLGTAPWHDPSWEFWAHASAVHTIPKGIASRLIDVHPPHCFMEGRKNGFRDYYEFLKRCRTPIYMQEVYPDIPASVRYPLEQVKEQYPYHFGSQAAALVGLALIEGVTHLGFWGVEYAQATEYASQRAHTLLWIGIALGQGVQVVAPKSSRLLENADGDYGWDSHKTPEQYAALKDVFKKARAVNHAPEELKPILTPADESAALARRREMQPAWAKEVAAFKDEEVPAWLLAQEQRERDEAEQHEREIVQARLAAR